MNDTERLSGPVVVLGSKPEALFPLVPAGAVLTANGAVELALGYRTRYNSRIIALVPGEELKRHPHIQESFKKGRPDEIVVLGDKAGDITAFIRHDLGLEAPITILGFHEANWTLAASLGAHRRALAWECLRAYGLRHALTTALPDFFGKRDMLWMSRSTGLNAILYAHERFPSAERIIAAGIGLQAGSHFNGVGQFTNKTAKADQMFVPHWPPELRPWLSTTDDAMSTLGQVAKWEGETFDPSA
jgi:hypothetical protein